MARVVLTDKLLKSERMRQALPGQRLEQMDAVVPGLAFRVTDKGKQSFVLIARYPGSTNPTRRSLGDYGPMSLDGARRKAREWIELLQRGSDPREAEPAQEVRPTIEKTFGAVAEAFIKRRLPATRKAGEVERDIRRELIVRWGSKPIVEITPADVTAVIDAIVDRGSPYQAHNTLGYCRRIFNWAIARGSYGLHASPCDRLKPSEVIGAKKRRRRVLSDEELFLLWRVVGRLGYPYGPIFQLLVLTGQRKSEIAEAERGELHRPSRLLTITAERMKADQGHAVPLPDLAVAILDALPRFNSGPFLFSTTFGAKPVSGFSKVKNRIDDRMLRTARALARKRGDRGPVTVQHWRIHDIRRTVRTRLSELKVPWKVAELIIAHAQPELDQVYDQHAYLEEKREALELWAARLKSIVEPRVDPRNIVTMKAVRR